MSLSKVKQVLLDKLNDDFIRWQKATSDISKENNSLVIQIRSLQKQIQASQVAEKSTLEENSNLKIMVDKLQSILLKRCDLEVENRQKREQIANMKDTAKNLEEEHKKQMLESMKNLEAANEAHKKELTRLKDEAAQQTKRELALTDKSIQEQACEIRQLQKQLVDMEREKHTELVKLRLEYDAKLLKVQKSNVNKSQNGQNANSNSDIFRKKLQAVRSESEREITNLKSKVAQLERRLAREQNSQTPHSQPFSLKRKRF
ncbi:coiled-coil domain-containing protein 91 [Nematostella vectensis]|uniref:coiled-coil domain-containing protein 91 n=1 Tax=Nematostella vectensis TaxID=45351 RepID=UPI00207744B4|nr:coiled-coil domain-containing protein 91 [Nematostella vectensis]